MVVNIAISSTWKVVGFKKTHLVERMSLLTLYILGEGVIDVLKSIGKVSPSRPPSNPPFAHGSFSDCTGKEQLDICHYWPDCCCDCCNCKSTNITHDWLLIWQYLLYMLYFDCLNHKHFGSIRQMIWAFGHFPFHVALVSFFFLARFVSRHGIESRRSMLSCLSHCPGSFLDHIRAPNWLFLSQPGPIYVWNGPIC